MNDLVEVFSDAFVEVLKSFPSHEGRPGLVGGSKPRESVHLSEKKGLHTFFKHLPGQHDQSTHGRRGGERTSQSGDSSFVSGTGRAHYEQFCKLRDKLPADKHAFLSDYDASYLMKSGFQVFISKSGKTGFAIAKDGDLCNLFSTEHRGGAAIKFAKKHGAKKLDCFDGKLVEIYKSHGFTEYKREKNWTLGDPDVVYMHLAGVKAMDTDKYEKEKAKYRRDAMERALAQGITWEQAEAAAVDMFEVEKTVLESEYMGEESE